MRKRATLISLVILFTLAGLAVYFVFNLQYFKDLAVVKTADQQPAALALSKELGLTDKGKFLYQTSQPRLEKAKDFNQSCSGVIREQTAVLGCYTMQRLYIFDVKDQRLNGIEQVTAAHELLHAVYERLPADQKAELNQQLDAAAKKITEKRFEDTMLAYRKTAPDQVPNELHSILGTEYSDLSPELEAHYRQYFTDRSKIVGYANKYVSVFTELENKQVELKSQLDSLKSQISTLETSIQSQQATLASLKAQMDSARLVGNILVYNSLVNSYNSRVADYNTDIRTYQSNIKTHNDLVGQYNQLANTKNDLVHELDSQYQTTH